MIAPPTTTGPASIVGREAELKALAGLIDEPTDGPRVLLLEGEAGIGKTTLWRWGVDRARDRRHVVLSCRPAETEVALPFAALGDVLEPNLDEILAELTAPQRVALEIALARVEPTERLGRLAVGRAALAAIREFATRRPLVLAIDDAQWLDPSTADALEFVVRRLDELPVRILITRRRQEDPVPLALDRALRPEALTRLPLDSFSIGELDGLLRTRLDIVLERPRLIELHRITGGNPFYALEIARAAARRSPEVPGDFTVPDSLGELLLDRLQALSADAQDAILLAAGTLHPSAALVEKAAGGSAGLAEAVREGMLELVGDRLAFAHPLLASVAYGSAMPWTRREAHRQLAHASTDPLERARHLALATEEADDAIAAEIDQAALRAHRLGAPTVAAELADHACRLTPTDAADALLPRMARSAEYHLAEGDSVRGRALLEQVVASQPPGPDRAELLLDLGRVRLMSDDLAAAQRLFQQALEEAGDDVRVKAHIEQALAFAVIGVGDIPRALDYARSSLHLAEQLDDGGLVALSLCRVVLTEFLLGMGFDPDRMERAIRLEDQIGDAPLEWRPSYVRAFITLCVDELETARRICERLHGSALEQGDERSVANILIPMSMVETAAGNWGLASRYAEESVERSRQSGLTTLQGGALSALTRVTALLGQEARVRALAEEGLAIAGRIGAVPWTVELIAALGFLELSLGNPGAAHHHLGPLSEMVVGFGLGEPGVVRFLPDEIEALVALGELDRARPMTTMLLQRGRELDRPWAIATGARSAALVAAAEGNFDEARDAIDCALAAHERLSQPFELARTLLVQGMIERRAKRRGEARLALTDALEIFDSLGAPQWAEKAAAELARIPGRGVASGELSPTEQRVAELAAVGLTNKEIAAKLYVTVRTIEWNLSKVYAKLGVRSRTELSGRLSGEDGS
jgi:DNA-binding CsgD family transcriptional regulator